MKFSSAKSTRRLLSTLITGLSLLAIFLTIDQIDLSFLEVKYDLSPLFHPSSTQGNPEVGLSYYLSQPPIGRESRPSHRSGCRGLRRAVAEIDFRRFGGVASEETDVIAVGDGEALMERLRSLIQTHACRTSRDLSSPLIQSEKQFAKACRSPQIAVRSRKKKWVSSSSSKGVKREKLVTKSAIGMSAELPFRKEQCLESLFLYRARIVEFMTRTDSISSITDTSTLAHLFFAEGVNKKPKIARLSSILDRINQLHPTNSTLQKYAAKVRFVEWWQARKTPAKTWLRGRFLGQLAKASRNRLHDFDIMELNLLEAAASEDWDRLERLAWETLWESSHQDLALYHLAWAKYQLGQKKSAKQILEVSLKNAWSSYNVNARLSLKRGFESRTLSKTKPVFQGAPIQFGVGFQFQKTPIQDPFVEVSYPQSTTFTLLSNEILEGKDPEVKQIISEELGFQQSKWNAFYVDSPF